MNFRKLFLLVGISCLLLLSESCKKEKTLNPCLNTICQNGGTCNNGICDCLDGFSGLNCEIQEPCLEVNCVNGGICLDGFCNCPDGYYGGSCEYATIQQRLLTETPSQILEDGFLLDSFYGKFYGGGVIFEINTNGNGMIVTLEDAPNLLSLYDAIPYCEDLVLEGKDDWILPTYSNLSSMWLNLANPDGNGQNTGPSDPNNLAGFEAELYWSSTENDFFNSWQKDFGNGDLNVEIKVSLLVLELPVLFN